jgi:hypothetical protein
MDMTRQNVVDEIAPGRGYGQERGTIVPSRPPAREGTPPVAPGAAVERALLDAVERATRREAAVDALLLRLSRLPPPGARPHHRRIARSLLDEAAMRGGGQVFTLRNSDLVLLGPEAAASRSLLAQLFTVDGIVEVLAPGAALLSYASERAAETLPWRAAPDGPSPAAPASPLAAAEVLVQRARTGDLLRGQIAAELRPDGTLRPVFREASPRLATLAAGLPGGGDPLVFRDLARALAARTLDAVLADIGQGGDDAGPLLARGGLALHLNLTLATVLSPDFRHLAEAARARPGDDGARVGIELDLVEACGDPAGFGRARDAARAAGFALALDGVGHQALLLTRPARLGADLVKVEWSDALAAAGPDADAALREVGPARVVLTGADGERAMRWGYARKVRRFQGAHVDVALAASRQAGCAYAAECTLRLCAERASATSNAGRTGCRDATRLDGAAESRL